MIHECYEDILERLTEDIVEDILCEGDIVKVVRSEKASRPGYHPVIAYYHEDDECDESHEEIMVSELIQELKHYYLVI